MKHIATKTRMLQCFCTVSELPVIQLLSLLVLDFTMQKTPLFLLHVFLHRYIFACLLFHDLYWFHSKSYHQTGNHTRCKVDTCTIKKNANLLSR